MDPATRTIPQGQFKCLRHGATRGRKPGVAGYPGYRTDRVYLSEADPTIYEQKNFRDQPAGSGRFSAEVDTGIFIFYFTVFIAEGKT